MVNTLFLKGSNFWDSLLPEFLRGVMHADMIPLSVETRLSDRLHQHLRQTFTQKKQIRILVPVSDLQAASPFKPWFHCKGVIDQIEIPCICSYGNWKRLQITSEEKRTGIVNLVDHFSELLPARGNQIGLVTFQNGIRHQLKDFSQMAQAIFNRLPEQPLCIGIYNPTDGLRMDFLRVSDNCVEDTHQLVNQRSCHLYVMFNTFANLLRQINPELHWTHIAHSEAAIIAKMALKSLEKSQREYLANRLITLTYGPVAPIPKSSSKFGINTYSNTDLAILGGGYSSQYANNGDYTIKWVESLSFSIIDHDFLGPTYQEALKMDLLRLRTSHGF